MCLKTEIVKKIILLGKVQTLNIKTIPTKTAHENPYT